jgi:hypothetical protein
MCEAPTSRMGGASHIFVSIYGFANKSPQSANKIQFFTNRLPFLAIMP